MTLSESCRQNLYFPGEMLTEIQNEARRQDRTASWIIQQAWLIARKELRRLPSTTDYLPDSEPGEDTPKDKGT